MKMINGNLLSGVLGPVKFSVRKGKQIVSKAVTPGTMKQSQATKKASTVFGKASALCKLLRWALGVQYGDLFSNEAINSLTGTMYPILKDSKDPKSGSYNFERDSFSRLEHLEFNEQSKVSNLMSKRPEVSLEGEMLNVSFLKQQIPRDFKFPRGSLKCELQVALVLFRLKEGLAFQSAEVQSINITKRDQKIDPHTFQFKVPGGCLCVVTIFLNYAIAEASGWKLLKDRTFSPAVICAALYTPGAFQENAGRLWKKILKFE